MKTLNLGILAHVDAGKTSLTERLLYAAGVIDEIGSVDDGSTQTDSLALERQRGITIKSAVVSFAIDDITVNLIDTPGHPDFIAEVERVLSVLDGAVLVVSAVEGVQAQTRVLMRTLQRLRIPTLIFVNKIDRSGAQYDHVLRRISEKLVPASIPMGSTKGLGTRGARFTPYTADDATFRSLLVDLLADHDDALLAAFVEDETTVPYGRLRHGLAAQTQRAQVHPVFFGSAITGAGVDALIAGIKELLPAAHVDTEEPLSGTVFKVERGPAGEKIAYVRMFSGTVRTRDRLRFRGADGARLNDTPQGSDRADEAKVTAISVFEHGSAVRRSSVSAGQIGKLWGLGGIRIGDEIGVPRKTAADGGYFAPPTLETVVIPSRPSDKSALHAALTQLAEQDPLINLRQDDIRQEVSVSLYGEVQKEVIQATLAEDFGLEVTFRESTTICIERPTGTGSAAETIGKQPNPFLATVGLRIDPAPIGSGVEFRLEVELGSMPFSFIKAVEETVTETLREGIHGWQVTDCTVTMTHSGYWARQSHSHGVFDKSMSSTAGDFRNLTPLVLMTALRQAGTTVYEPMHRFRLELPADLFGPLLPVLARLRAVPRTPSTQGTTSTLEGDIPAARVHELEQLLPGLTRGEGVLECAFDRYESVRGTPPTRPRTDHNPLNRKEYLVHVVRRV
ncbi:TetM/TetW/TetO/TetS family tetracycline resistance ribosomal protection protein [Streptomyces sp. PSKA54]|uniref:TetM/TetW/TetO/TetS family tetracycline resistance ribosomal protection protein n=1 Tax=Streptomyces himalayensis subsp. aureolus TaxID=2758039 RepID=A0A7W2D2W2_9ACTN|nr:TetM/TetW/TetO/TetS family tetracycline resistance ribosomal protection protein [Streptomyces himalayensis]MBA4863736.1 TetM/TetW/TetO/TetS family tetracycline resistance ribosomal protection protein [Streptomyces himalayensis subsp. aureolus]